MVLLGLLLQVQTVFACQMMEHSGHAEHCCCDEMVTDNNAKKTAEHDSPCCDFNSEISLKNPQVEDDEPVILQQNYLLELPQVTLFYIITSLWPLEIKQPVQFIAWEFGHNPSALGTDTYLSTLRLRI